MNMSVTEFVVPPAIVGRSRSVWREIIDTVMEGPPRTAADEITEYLARHQYDLSPTCGLSLSGVTSAYSAEEPLRRCARSARCRRLKRTYRGQRATDANDRITM
jgi:hypothetical protein